MNRKSTLDALFGTKPAPLGAPNNGEEAAAPEVKAARGGAPRTGAVAALGASLQQWGEAARTAEALQAQLAAARSVVELDPESVDAAPVRDRLPIETDKSFESLVRSIGEAGQQVPILVRPHPAKPGHYQAAYGHRRLAAARQLGRQVRAIVADLSDEALVLAQGKENSERRDLSFIERALFARRLEEAGQPRAVIGTALSIDKGDLSRIIAVAKSVPEPLIRLIGPAPQAGRARWLKLAETVGDAAALARAEAATTLPAFADADTDRRFGLVLAAAASSGRTESGQDGARALIPGDAGRAIATVAGEGSNSVRFSIDNRQAPDFAAFVAAELPSLYQRWRGVQGLAAAGQGPRIRQTRPPRS